MDKKQKKKKRGKHRSLDKSLKRAVAWIEDIPEVAGVIISLTESCRHKFPAGHVRCLKDTQGGLRRTDTVAGA